MPIYNYARAATGGGITEYDSLADLPSNPTDGDQAVVGGLLLTASGGEWVYEVLPSPMSSSSTTAPGNVANTLAFTANEIDPDEDLDAPTSTSAWTTVT
jgi:hypothetical protein